MRTRPPFEWIALLLQGGGALAAYQAGVYQAATLDWAAGISIGAINSAIIAPEEGVELKRPSAGDKHELGQHLTPRLVPSRYALRVGEIDVLVVSDGVLSLPGAMLGHNADPSVRAAWLEDMFLPPDMLEWALNAVVVRIGDRTILIDAGIGVDPA